MVKNMINPEEYTVSVRMESVDGERMYVARIQELPDVEEYADTAAFARELALDSILTIHRICVEKGLPFPEPIKISVPDVSGRVTLRLAKQLHADAIKIASIEGISLNQFLSNAILNAVTYVKTVDVFRQSIDDLVKKTESRLYSSYKTTIERKRLSDTYEFHSGRVFRALINTKLDETVSEKTIGIYHASIDLKEQAVKTTTAVERGMKFKEVVFQ
ncbi:toxin-antitoxin system HicB family antitoxin [Aeromonas caviae]|uniref:toxin-antitoxin system HicB family antitoxin n=1 Tax=Aeromonas caviae TaxID=648 RepID=UPI0009BBDA2A|nr:toxin-antitoxin system HicB family antitoxin [Aeromonas caviae]